MDHSKLLGEAMRAETEDERKARFLREATLMQDTPVSERPHFRGMQNVSGREKLQVWVRRPDLVRLADLAAEAGISVSEYVRRLIREAK